MNKLIAIASVFFAGMMLFAEDVTVSIQGSDRPRIGKALVAGANAEGCSYIWRKGDWSGNFSAAKLSSGESYTPKADDYEHWIKVEAYTNNVLAASSKFWFSKLPVAYFDTDDGLDITDKETYKTGILRIQGNDEFKEQYNGEMEIKGRGNSSWSSYQQKPYKLKLAKKTDLFGFGKNKHWVLISNYEDRAMMRNKFGSELAKELGIVGMDMTWVVGIKNGVYNGVYMLAEHIRIDGNRVDIFDWEAEGERVADELYAVVGSEAGWSNNDKKALETCLSENFSWVTSAKVTYRGVKYDLNELGIEYQKNIDGGYLFEFDNRYDELSKFTSNNGLKINVNKPEYLYTNAKMMDHAKALYDKLESAYSSEDGYSKDAEPKHYRELADEDSMAAYWLTMELLSNVDGNGYSRFGYKDVNGVLKYGPAWDFDVGVGSSKAPTWGSRSDPEAWAMLNDFWKSWSSNPIFLSHAREMYNNKARKWLVNAIANRIPTIAKYLQEAASTHDAKFPGSRTYQEDVDAIKTFLSKRLVWLDGQFDTIHTLVKGKKLSISSDKKASLDYLPIMAEPQLYVGAPELKITNIAHGKTSGFGLDVQLSFGKNKVKISKAEVKKYLRKSYDLEAWCAIEDSEFTIEEDSDGGGVHIEVVPVQSSSSMFMKVDE